MESYKVEVQGDEDIVEVGQAQGHAVKGEDTLYVRGVLDGPETSACLVWRCSMGTVGRPRRLPRSRRWATGSWTRVHPSPTH